MVNFPQRLRAAGLSLTCSLLLVLTGALGLSLPARPVLAQQNAVELDLRDADLRSFVQIVSEATGRNFVLDPQVRGTVTVLAPQAMSAAALYEVFLNVLELNRLTVIEGAEADRIVPMNVARELASGSGSNSGADAVGGYETRVIEVQNVPLNEIIEVVRPLLPAEAVITPVPNARLLILSDRGNNHRRIETLIKRLDQPREQPIEMIRLDHAEAADIQQTVLALEITPAGASLSVDRRSNALVVTGPADFRRQVRLLAERLDTREEARVTHVETLKYADAASLADVVLRSFQQASDDGQGAVRIVADTQNNGLIISAPQEQMPDIIGMVRYLDKRPTQVLVEAVIFEMSVEGFSDLSAQFAGVVNDAIIGGVQFSLAGRPSLVSLISAAQSGSATDPGAGGTFGYGDNTGDDRFLGFISAIARTNSTRLLSTPSIMTLNNQEAEIVVAQNVPFVTGSFATVGDSAVPENPFQTIERQDIGLTLNVTPQINADDTVRLAIKQEVSNLTNSSAAAGGEITAKRALSTNVLVSDGNVIMLGGLLENGSGSVKQQVPGLSKLPLVGGLFKGRNATKTQRVLLVMLRPRVVSTDKEARALTRELAREARKASLEIQPLDAPTAAFPFDGADLNQPFDAGFIDDGATRLNLPPLPSRLRFGN